MPTDAALLTLAQWFSPAYPLGSFAYSHGLETLIVDGQIADATTLHNWIAAILDHGSGRSDATFLAAAYHADADVLPEIDAWCRAYAPSAGRLMETDLQGAAFCSVTGAVWGTDLRGLTYPVAAGRAARLAGLPLPPTAQMFLHAFASALVSTGIRLIPLGQTEGQALIRRLMPLCLSIAEDTQAGDLETLASTAFAADIASMTHETLYSKVFRT